MNDPNDWMSSYFAGAGEIPKSENIYLALYHLGHNHPQLSNSVTWKLEVFTLRSSSTILHFILHSTHII